MSEEEYRKIVLPEELIKLLERIDHATQMEIPEIYRAALNRYNDLLPDWNICSYSIEKKGDYAEQIDDMIRFLESLKRTVKQ